MFGIQLQDNTAFSRRTSFYQRSKSLLNVAIGDAREQSSSKGVTERLSSNDTFESDSQDEALEKINEEDENEDEVSVEESSDNHELFNKSKSDSVANQSQE